MRIGRFLLKVGGVAIGLVFALIATFRDLFAAADSQTQDDDTLGSSIRGGDLNFRKGKSDDGTDPAGWYGRVIETGGHGQHGVPPDGDVHRRRRSVEPVCAVGTLWR